MSNKDNFRKSKLKLAKNGIGFNKAGTSFSVRSYSQKDILVGKELLNSYSNLKGIVNNVDSFYGLVNLYRLSKGQEFIQQINTWVENDSKISTYLSSDFEKLGRVNNKDLNEIKQRLRLVQENVDRLDMLTEDKMKVAKDIRDSPETYFKFSRSIDCQKNGFTPSYFSEVLEKQGYSKEDLTKLMSLIHLPSCCTKDAEWKFLMEARAKFEPVKEGVKVIHENDVTNYLNNKDYNRVFGFVADEGLYQHRFNRADLTLCILRLDYPKTTHFVNNTEKTYAIYFFGPDVGEKCIPPIQRELTLQSNGDVSINVPYSPNTGNAFTSSRNHMIIPEFQISYDDAVLIKDSQMILGYFDNQGDFHPQHAYVQDKWVSVEDFFDIHEQIKTADKTGRTNSERDITVSDDIPDSLPSGKNEVKPKDISFDGFDR